MLLFGTERANLPRFRNRAPFYEVYYLRFTDLAQQLGVWYRQTLLARPGLATQAALWLILFDLEGPGRSLVHLRQEPLALARLENDIFYFETNGGRLYHRGTHGEIQHEGTAIRWNLSWEPAKKTLYHFPSRLLYHLPFPQTKVLSPNPEIQLSGTLEWGPRCFEFKQVEAQQSHLWGRRHADQWCWGQLKNGGEPELFFEGLSAGLVVGGRRLPDLTLLHLRWGGRDFRFHYPWQWRKNRSLARLDRWHFEGEGGGNRISGDVFVEPAQILGVTYMDPDGSKRYCYHTESARLELKLYQLLHREWVEKKTFRSEPVMAYEFATSAPLPEIPLRV